MDLINRDALKKEYCDCCVVSPDCMGSGCKIYNARCLIEELPTIDAEPVKHGQWIHIRTSGVISVWKCSECDNTITANFANTNPSNHDKFCYNCGAKMDGGVDNV